MMTQGEQMMGVSIAEAAEYVSKLNQEHNQ